MPRPRPLTNLGVTSGTGDYQSLTPRTPHSRAGRAEEGFTEVELELDSIHEEDDEDTHYRGTHHQSVPLLSSSASDSFPATGYRSRGDDYDSRSGGKEGKWGWGWEGLTMPVIIDRLPLLMGTCLAGILFIMIVMSFKRPEALQRFMGVEQFPIGASPVADASSSYSPEPVQDELKMPTSTLPTPPDLPTPPSPPSPPSSMSDPHTLSYENYTQFPLLPSQYRSECNKLMSGFMTHGAYWDTSKMGPLDVLHHDEAPDYQLPEGEAAVCSATITYMLDGYVGLLADLALMAQAAALARERNRTFLVDDTYWNRGKWTDHFQDVRARQPGPEPGCRAPPPDELVACPRLSRHWVINSRTAKYHFGHGFADNYEDAYAQSLNRKKPIFLSSQESFRNTIRPNAQTSDLIRSARAEFSERISPSDNERKLSRGEGEDEERETPYIGVHLRRGDRHATSWSFHGGYVPIADYAQAVKDTWSRLFSQSDSIPVVYLASDSPPALSELASVLGPQTVVYSLSHSQDPTLQALVSLKEYVQNKFNELDEATRVTATKGMIVDFALLNGMWAWKDDIIPAATVCTVTSNICKLSAVGLGWDRAFGDVDLMGNIDDEKKGWVEIDEKGVVRPMWEPFELF